MRILTISTKLIPLSLMKSVLIFLEKCDGVLVKKEVFSGDDLCL